MLPNPNSHLASIFCQAARAGVEAGSGGAPPSWDGPAPRWEETGTLQTQASLELAKFYLCPDSTVLSDI